MIKLNEKQIVSTYNMIADYHKKYLNQYGVKLPRLFSGAQYTKDALVLVYLAQDYPNTRIISKNELTEFIRLFDQNVLDVQQARHLGAQKGWFILSGTRNDNASETLQPPQFLFFDIKKRTNLIG